MLNSDQEIANAIAQQRGSSAMPQVEYRKMKALERIADMLEALEPLIERVLTPPMMVPDTVSGVATPMILPGDPTPAEHRRRRREPVGETPHDVP